MLRLRIKMGPSSRNKEWSCLFGLHVRTATIIIGVWHLCLNLLALGMLTFIIRNPAMVNELENGLQNDIVMDQEMAPALPTPLSKIDPPPYASYRDHDMNYQNVDMSGFVCLCMVAISSMMIFGAVKGKPSHLLPFFCLQLFDFAITTLTAANFLCYLRSVHRLIENHRLPWREELLEMSPQSLSILVLVVFLSVVLLKAYAIGIVWRCYKFLTLQRQNLTSMLPYIIPDVSGTNGGADRRLERDYSSLLPDYDEAIAQSMKQAPPPSYQVAMFSVNGHVNLGDTENEANARREGNEEAASTSQNDITPPPPPYDAAAAAANGDSAPIAVVVQPETTSTEVAKEETSQRSNNDQNKAQV